MLHSRIRRVQGEYNHALANIITFELNDPRVEFASVTNVKISKDLREAVVHISFLGDDPEKATEGIEALEQAKGFIKRILATRISLKRLPDPRFVLDTAEREAFRLFHIIDKVRKEDELISFEEINETEASTSSDSPE